MALFIISDSGFANSLICLKWFPLTNMIYLHPVEKTHTWCWSPSGEPLYALHSVRPSVRLSVCLSQSVM